MEVKVFIKNMVCPRCVAAVAKAADDLGLVYHHVMLGEVEFSTDLSDQQLMSFSRAIEGLGFAILDDKRKQQVEEIKKALIGLVQGGEIDEHFSLGKFLPAQMHRAYPNLSTLFSEVEGITIEQFFILQKVEKVKEWLAYEEASLSEMAFRLGYSSVQHLSTQFKKVTGMTPSQFRKIGLQLRKPIDGLR